MARFLFLYAAMTVAASILGRLTGCPSLFSLPEQPSTLALSLALAVVLALVVVGGGRALEGVPWYREMARFLKRLLTNPDLLGPRLDGEKAFVVAVYSSVGEEALFRGFVQPWIILHLQDWLGPGLAASALGVLLASLVFGALHPPLARELIPWTAFALVAGVLFGGLAAWSGSLLAPIVAHLLINWLNIRRLMQLPLDPSDGPLAGPLP